MKKNLLVIIILTIAIVAGIYNLHDGKNETIQMQSTLQQPAKEVKPVITPVKPDKPVGWDDAYSKFNPIPGWFAIDGKEFFIDDLDIIQRYGKYWINSREVPGMVGVLKNKEAMRDKARAYFSPNTDYRSKDMSPIDRLFDWNAPLIYKGIKLAEFQVWSDGMMYCPLAEVLAVEGYPVTYYSSNKFASIEHDKMEKEWLKYTRMGEALEYSANMKAGTYTLKKYALTKELFKPQPIYDMIKESVYEIPYQGYTNSSIAGNKQTMLRSNNASVEDIYIKLDKSLLSEKIPYTGSLSYHGDFSHLFVTTNYILAGEEIYYLGTKTLEVNDGKYATWQWIPGSNILIKRTNDRLQDGLRLFGNWYDIILLPVGTKLRVQDFEAMKPEEQVTITNQVFKPLWDINNPTK